MGGKTYTPRRAWESALHRVVSGYLETFLAAHRSRGRAIPFFVTRDFRAFLACGIPAHGFLRVHCQKCGRDRIVPFSCKGRGFCPSCCGRRMADTAAHLIDTVLPVVPVRQWVLTVPHALRFLMAYDHAWLAAVHHIFINAVFASLRRRAGLSRVGRNAKGGIVTFVQRFGDALNLNVHFHALALDGVYVLAADGAILFHQVPSPTREELTRVTTRLAQRIERLFARRKQSGDFTVPPDEDDLLSELYGAMVSNRALVGPRAGLKPDRLRSLAGHDADNDEPTALCAEADGFRIHAGTSLPAADRAGIERLCRYMCRPPIALERLQLRPDGRLQYRLKQRWRDGTDRVIFEPLEFMERLAALVPAPRFNMIRYSGVLAPAAAWRAYIAPVQERETASQPIPAVSPPSSPSAEPCEHHPRARHYAWAELLKRVFAVDALQCDCCGGRMRILCAIHPPEAIRKILTCLGLPIRDPPLAPALFPDHEYGYE